MKRFIKNFNPDIKKANFIVKKRVLPYFLCISIFFLVLLAIFIILYILNEKTILNYLTMITASFSLLALVTVAWIFDFGAASKIKKENFKSNGIKSIQQGHTYYYALKKIGVLRLLINFLLFILCIIFGIVNLL